MSGRIAAEPTGAAGLTQDRQLIDRDHAGKGCPRDHLHLAGPPPANGAAASAATRLEPAQRSLPRVPALGAAACAVGVVLTCAAAVIGDRSSIVDRPELFGAMRAVTCLGVLALAHYAFERRGNDRLAILLVVVGYLFALAGLTAVNAPGPFVAGRIAVAAGVLVAIYVCLSYPRGRIEDRLSSRFMATAAAGSAGLLAANLLLSSFMPVAGPFVRCSGSACPSNPLNVVDLAVGPSRALSTAFGLWTGAILTGTGILLARRARKATRLQRHSLGPVLGWSLIAAVAYGGFVCVRAVDAHSRALTPAAIVVAAIVALMPVAIALGMASGRVLATGGLERTMAELAGRPSWHALQSAMARAFGDPSLRLLLWLPSLRGYVDVDGRRAELPMTGPHREVTELARDGDRVAAVVHDPALGDEPATLEAAGSAALLALDNARLDADLRASVMELEASRKRLASCADGERRRIERDLHDGAQQQLTVLRIKLGLLEQLAAQHPTAPDLRSGLAEAGEAAEAAIDGVRDLARGIYPALLRTDGLRAAIAAVARDAPIRVNLEAGHGRRFAPEIEAAVYFCSLEALQNAAKHGGENVSANVRLSCDKRGIQFAVADDGVGFDPSTVTHERGIVGMRDRLAAVGGDLEIDSSPGAGTRVIGRVPAHMGAGSGPLAVGGAP